MSSLDSPMLLTTHGHGDNSALTGGGGCDVGESDEDLLSSSGVSTNCSGIVGTPPVIRHPLSCAICGDKFKNPKVRTLINQVTFALHYCYYN